LLRVHIRPLLVIVLALGLLSARLPAGESGRESECQKSASFFAPPDSPEYRKYAPDREINVVNLALDVTPDFTNRTIAGSTTLTFKPIAKPLTQLSLDAVDLRVASVTSTVPVALPGGSSEPANGRGRLAVES